MSTINKAAVLNPFTDLTDDVFKYAPRATSTEYGVVALGSGIHIDALGRIYTDTQVYLDRFTVIEDQIQIIDENVTTVVDQVNNTLDTKSDKTYVDNQLTFKANKSDVYTKSETYTKQESTALVNNSIATSLIPVNTSLALAKRGAVNRYDSSFTYNLGERVILANGDEVKSTAPNNTKNPNVDMNGWVKTNDASQILDTSKLNRNQKDINSDFNNIKDHSSLQNAINNIDQTSNIIKRGEINFNPLQEINIPTQIEVNKARINFEGRNALLKWTAPNSIDSMFHITDSSYTKFRDLILIGDANTPPKAAMYFDNSVGMVTGTNEKITIEDVIIGRKYIADTDTGGSVNTGTPYGKVLNGIVVGGAFDGNNDEYYLNNVSVHEASEAGFDFRNTQSIWSSINNCLANGCGTSYKLGCNMTMYNPQSNRSKVADLHGVRNIEVSVFGMQSEHAEMFVWSQGGASFSIKGGELQKKSTLDGYFFKVENGGNLVLEDLFVENISNDVTQLVSYRSGSVKIGLLRVKNCTIQKGGQRNTWAVNTASAGALQTTIDIEHGDFVFKTTKPYFEEVKAAGVSVLANSTALQSSSTATLITPSNFYSYTYSQPIGTLQIPVNIDTNVARLRFLNRTVTQVDLPAGIMRVMNLGDYISQKGSKTSDLGTIAGKRQVAVTVPLIGAKVGDYIVPSSSDLLANYPLYAYVSADNVATVIVESIATGSATLGVKNVAAAKIIESKLKYHGSIAIATPLILADKAIVSYDVSVAGVQLGAHCFVSYTSDLLGLTVTAHAQADNIIRVVIYNNTGAQVTLPIGGFKVAAAF